MIRNSILILIALIFLSPLSGYASAERTEKDDSHFLGLTQRQRLEDYDYLWKSLSENYPFFGVARRAGIDVESVYLSHRREIEASDSDIDFHNAVNLAMHDLQFIGHIQMINVWNYNEYVDVYAKPPVATSIKPWARALTAGKTRRCYERTIAAFQPKTFVGETDPSKPNLSFEILEPGRTAYVKIDSFSSGRVKTDREPLLSFYRQISGYENLIVDLTDNGGGADRYWEDLIVSRNISAPVVQQEAMLFADTPVNREYVLARFSPEDIFPVERHPLAGEIRDDGAGILTHFATMSHTITPNRDGRAFDGKLWVLVGENVYSASESFARFCQSTGFATLVGDNTGGDGGGIDPVFLTLPNSGYLVRYSMMYTVNPDGSSNEEYGTTPDITRAAGQSALEACLNAINNKA